MDGLSLLACFAGGLARPLAGQGQTATVFCEEVREYTKMRMLAKLCFLLVCERELISRYENTMAVAVWTDPLTWLDPLKKR